MTFLNKFIEHEVPEEVKEWIQGEIDAQEERFAKIDQQMKDLAATREKWYQEFFDRLTTIGFNVSGDDKVLIKPGDLPVKPEGCDDQVVWKNGVDSDPAIDQRD
jgi:hypothetical protein